MQQNYYFTGLYGHNLYTYKKVSVSYSKKRPQPERNYYMILDQYIICDLDEDFYIVVKVIKFQK